jgi:hypothetical protein
MREFNIIKTNELILCLDVSVFESAIYKNLISNSVSESSRVSNSSLLGITLKNDLNSCIKLRKIKTNETTFVV